MKYLTFSLSLCLAQTLLQNKQGHKYFNLKCNSKLREIRKSWRTQEICKKKEETNKITSILGKSLVSIRVISTAYFLSG